MTNRTYRLLRGASLMVLAYSAAPAMAQVTPTGDASTDIVVTARRTEERLQDVPISITVFNQQQLQNRNIVSAGDLATYTPSLTANSRFGAESTSFAIRGFVQEGPTSPSVAVYFADVIAPRANAGTTSGNGAGVGALFDLQNVQVLKGPQGTLFGRNTTGGAVLLVPQKPTSTFGGYVEGSIGNYDLKRVQAVINAPFGDRFRVRFGVDRQKRDGYLNNISGIGPKDFSDTDYLALRLSTVVDLTDNLENYTIATYSRSNTNGFLPKVFVAVPGGYRFANYLAQIRRTEGNYYDVENGNPFANQTIEQWGIFNTTTFLASDTITLKNIVSYQEFRQSQTSNIYGDNGTDTTTTPTSFNTATAVFTAPNSHNASESTFTEELQLQGRTADDRLTYQAGGYFERALPLDGFQTTYSGTFLNCTNILAFQCTDVRGRLTPNGAGGTLEGRVGTQNVSRSRYSFRNAGIYAQATYKIIDSLSITGGLRYTMDRTFGIGGSLRANYPAANTPVFSCAQPVPVVRGGTSAQILADPTRCQFTRVAKSNKPTWLVDLDFKPVEDVLLYGKYSRGYRQGGINVSSYGLETWGPEKVDTYEIGAKTGFRSFVSGTLNVAAFYNDFSNQQIAIGTVTCTGTDLITMPAQCPFQGGGGQGIANTGKSTIKGVEVDGAITVFTGLNLSGSYAYLKTKLKSIVPPTIPVGFRSLTFPIVGGALPLTPKNKFTITGSYTLPLDESVGRVSFSATYTHQSGQFGSSSSLSNAQIRAIPLLASNPTFADEDFRFLPGQQNLNVNINWNKIAGTPVDLQLFATNVTKEKFRVQTLGGSGTFGLESFIVNPPRMYGARLRYTFGS